MRRPLTRAVVAAVVLELVGAENHEQSVHGFEWKGWRLMSGGGIAGNMSVWWLVEKAQEKAGEKRRTIGPLTTVKMLRRAITENLREST